MLRRRAIVSIGGAGPHAPADHRRPPHGQRSGVLAHMAKIVSIVGLEHPGYIEATLVYVYRLCEWKISLMAYVSV